MQDIMAARRKRAERKRRMAELAGRAAPVVGGAAGTAIGAGIGAAFGGVGAGPGAAIGGGIGTAAGSLFGLASDEFGGADARKMDEADDAQLQKAMLLRQLLG